MLKNEVVKGQSYFLVKANFCGFIPTNIYTAANVSSVAVSYIYRIDILTG